MKQKWQVFILAPTAGPILLAGVAFGLQFALQPVDAPVDTREEAVAVVEKASCETALTILEIWVKE